MMVNTLKLNVAPSNDNKMTKCILKAWIWSKIIMKIMQHMSAANGPNFNEDKSQVFLNFVSNSFFQSRQIERSFSSICFLALTIPDSLVACSRIIAALIASYANEFVGQISDWNSVKVWLSTQRLGLFKILKLKNG